MKEVKACMKSVDNWAKIAGDINEIEPETTEAEPAKAEESTGPIDHDQLLQDLIQDQKDFQEATSKLQNHRQTKT